MCVCGNGAKYVNNMTHNFHQAHRTAASDRLSWQVEMLTLAYAKVEKDFKLSDTEKQQRWKNYL